MGETVAQETTKTPRSTHRSGALLVALAIGLAASGVAAAQSGDERNGVQFQGASVYVGFSSKALPPGQQSGFGNPYFGYGDIGSDANVGGATGVAWTASGSRFNASARYDVSYAGLVRHSEWSSLNHSLGLNLNRELGPRWSLGISMGASAADMYQSLFAPGALARAAAYPATFDDLAQAFLSGGPAGGELASLLNGGFGFWAPAETLIYGRRVITASIQPTLSYAHSGRFSIHFRSTSGRAMRWTGPNDDADPGRQPYQVPNTTSLGAGVGISYAWSPRTRVGLDVSSARTFSTYQDAYMNQASASVAKTLSRRWFARVNAGAGFIKPVRQTDRLSTAPQPVYGGGLGYKDYAHGVLVSYSRTVGDSYGVGAGSTQAIDAGWSWSRPGGRWGLSAGLGQQQMESTRLEMRGWHFQAGLTRALTRQTMLAFTYAFLKNDGKFTGLNYDLNVHSVRIAVVWQPGRLGVW
jgi:hypothetical protein